MYALDWEPVDHAADGIIYDAGIRASKTPDHAYARWVKPKNWEIHMREIVPGVRERVLERVNGFR